LPHTRVTFLLSPPDPWRDLLSAELADLGYHAFEEGFIDAAGRSGELMAHIPADGFNAARLEELRTLRNPHVKASWTVEEIADRNWNAEWESGFLPVEVGKAVRVRADFHPASKAFTHELVITPRMAFGTGHHATTRMMISAMLGLSDAASEAAPAKGAAEHEIGPSPAEAGREGGPGLDLAGKSVCDLGCGTGILAILAERMGATHVLAADIDPGAVENAKVNVVRNGCHTITVEKGDTAILAGGAFDVILANIERNVLLQAMPLMAAALSPGGALLLSGFTVNDRHLLAERAKGSGLVLAERANESEWALLGCRKP